MQVNGNTKNGNTVRRALSKILPICFFSLLISGLVLSVANDMYAFVKDDIEVKLQLEEPYSLQEFSKILGQNEIVKNPSVFSLYVRLKNRSEKVEEFVGEVKLNSKMSYREILLALS